MKTIDNTYTKDFQDLLSYADQKLHNRTLAEDVVQEAYIRAIEGNIFSLHVNPSAWLCKAVRYNILTYYNRRKKEIFTTYETGAVDDNYDLVEIKEIMRSILSPDDYNLAEKIFVKGFTETELSKELGISDAGVRMRIMRIRQKLLKNFKIIFLIFWL